MNFERYGIPSRMQDGIKNYIEHGIPPGGFLTAIIVNDLKEACGRADDQNRHLLFEYVSFFYNEAPSSCWGSHEKFNQWIEMHNGLLEK